jgi:hypothetical protein
MYENEWDLVLQELHPELAGFNNEINTPEINDEPVFLTLGLSTDEGLMVSIDGDSDLLLIGLLSSLFNGDLDEEILEQVPQYKILFPNWGDEPPMIFPDQTLWETANEEE